MSHLACGAWAREPLERFHSNGKTGCYGGKLNETVHITGYSSFLVFTGIIVISLYYLCRHKSTMLLDEIRSLFVKKLCRSFRRKILTGFFKMTGCAQAPSAKSDRPLCFEFN